MSTASRQSVRGGRAAQNRIDEDLAAIDALLARIDQFAAHADERLYHNVDLAKTRLGQIRGAVQDARPLLLDLRAYLRSDLEKLLQRRDANSTADGADAMGAAETQELRERVARFEGRLARIEERLAAIEARPVPADTQTRGTP